MRSWVLFLAGLAAFAQDKNPYHGKREAIESGRGIFRIYCSPCHGIGGKGVRAPDLTIGNYSVGNSDEALLKIIASGAEGTEMPGFSERFDTDATWRIIAYIRSVATQSPPVLTGDRAEGEKIFWGKGGCGACHRVDGKGGRMGPDLTLVGRQRSIGYLEESLLDPNAQLTTGYNTITVVTRDGKTMRGVQKGYDAFSAQFMDVSDNFHSYFRDEVKEMKREFKSLMPPTKLPKREIDHLLAYMASLKGKGGVAK